MEKLHTLHMKFLDQSGRERIFNGLNFVDKKKDEDSYLPDWDEKNFKWCEEQGINLIRFGINWSSIEREMGIYDETYMQWIEYILDLCEKNNICVFLDMHQDLYSCLYGNGAPKWATLPDDTTHIAGDLWSDAYLYSPAVKRCFENFWANKPLVDGVGVQEHYINMWLYIIGRVKDHPALIGYDFFNEPFSGECGLEVLGTLLTTYAELTKKDLSSDELVAVFTDDKSKKQLLLELDDRVLYSQVVQAAEPLIKAFDTLSLQDFYQKIALAVRKVTTKGIFLIENCYFSNLGIPCNLSPLKDEEGRRESLQAYAPHGYDLVVDTPNIDYLSKNRLEVIFDTHHEVQKRLDIPVIIGEWGAHYMNKEGLEYIEYLLNKFDKYKWSHTYWCYDEYIQKAPAMSLLNRPYPQAVCGEIMDYCYDRKNNVFILNWDEYPDRGLESVIYLHKEPRQILFEDIFELKAITPSSEGALIRIPHKGLGKRSIRIYF